jgi:hypothetical protein
MLIWSISPKLIEPMSASIAEPPEPRKTGTTSGH